MIDSKERIIVFGGYTDDGYANDLFIINLIKERFENPLTTGTAPSPRENFAMSLINDRIYIFGGFQEGGVLNDLFSIDLLSWQWINVITQGPTPPSRQGMASTRVGNKIYLTGGCDYRIELCYTDTYILDTESLWWTKVDNSNNKTSLAARGDFAMMFFRSNIVGFGGCEMYKQCFNNVFIMNINDLCPNKCSSNGECKDVIGCVCNSGWITHDCSFEIKCQDDCNNHGVCRNTGRCACYPGWEGLTCGGFVDCPRNCTETANGLCQSDSTCKCRDGYDGLDCAQYSQVLNKTIADPIEELTAVRSEMLKLREIVNITNTSECLNNCSNQGVCNTTTGVCTCDTKYSGEDCSIVILVPIIKNTTLNSNNANNTITLNTTVIPTINATLSINATINSCSLNCTNGGICKDGACYCSQGFTSNDCSMTYKEFIEQGFALGPMIKYIVVAFSVASIVTLIILIVDNNKKIKAGDHFVFE